MNASELRLKARQSLTGNYWPAVLVAFVASIFGALLVNGGSFSINIEERFSEVFGNLPAIVKWYLAIVGSAAGVLSLVNLILGGVIQLGYASYLLKQHDREICETKELFSKFDYFGPGFLQLLLRNIFTALWSILLVIPGIIKILGYSMTPFLMVENPNLTAKEAIKLSQEKMMGHKWELFCMSLSFIGWSILATLTGGIGYIFLNPYMNAAYAAFYRDKISPKTAVYYEEAPVLGIVE